MEDIKFVQQRLWSNKHKTKRMPEGMGFDLMVDGKIKVRVAKISDHQHTSSSYDILAIVKAEIDGSRTVFYSKERNKYSRSFKSILKGGGK